MENFRKQIEEDIREYQNRYSHIAKLAKDEWAFNFWVLDKLFNEEEELIEEKVVDYHDLGIDAYEIYEDTKDVYLIQNKYYADDSPISTEYIKNDFLIRGITALENGTYRKSEELQSFFSKYKDDEDFTVYIQLYITNDRHNQEAENYLKQYNKLHPKYHAQIFYLSDIKEKYYGEIIKEQKKIQVKIETVNKGTFLNVNSESYKLANVIDARYVLTPIVSVYRMFYTAKLNSYPIFDRNIREYLGNKGVNKKIYQTLLDSQERKNFFYYNNGITIICDRMHSLAPQSSSDKYRYFMIDNPQIVNGCQTVNSIYEALKNINPEKLEEEYKDTFVMLKILEIDKHDITQEQLYRNIVKYNNSQNSIDTKSFVANTDIFARLQSEFMNKGFILLIKQSDKNKFHSEYKSISELNAKNHEYIERFAIKPPKKVDDLYIPLEKLLQTICAFLLGGQFAYTQKSKLLKFDTKAYNTAVDFIKNDVVTIDVLLSLYLLFRRADEVKSQSEEKRVPIPLYLIDFFGKYECQDRNVQLIAAQLNNKERIEEIIRLYSRVSKSYQRKYNEKYHIDYNKMIKSKIDESLVDDIRDMAIEM